MPADIHADTARRIFGVENPTPEQRRYAKQVNYVDWYSTPFAFSLKGKRDDNDDPSPEPEGATD